MQLAQTIRLSNYKYLIGPKVILSILLLLVTSASLLVNSIALHYQAKPHVNSLFWDLLPLLFLLSAVGYYIRKEVPRLATFFFSLTKIFIIALIIQFASNGLIFTPFHPVDQFMYHIDLSMGFNGKAVIEFARAHHWILATSEFVYNCLVHELIFVPLLLALLAEQRQLDIYLISALATALIGFAIYYFFPTSDPASVMHHIRFTSQQYQVVQQFQQIQAHQKLQHAITALIDFPSFHVIWAVIATYAVRNRKYLFYPLLILNILVVISTLTLGWHFLISVIGGFVVAFIGLWLAERTSIIPATVHQLKKSLMEDPISTQGITIKKF